MNELEDDSGEGTIDNGTKDKFVSVWKKLKDTVGEARTLNDEEIRKLETKLENAAKLYDTEKENDIETQEEEEVEELIGVIEIPDDFNSTTAPVERISGPLFHGIKPQSLIAEKDNKSLKSGPLKRSSIDLALYPKKFGSNKKKKTNLMRDEDTTEEPKVSINRLAELLRENQKGTSILENDSNAVMIIGSTGAGKTTFLKAMEGKEIVLQKDEVLHEQLYGVDGENDIGDSFKSETDVMKTHELERDGEHIYYIDTPGFDDTRSIEIDIARSVGVREVALRVKSLRFVVVINAHSFRNSKGRSFKDELTHVSNFIDGNFEEFKRSFIFLFTHGISTFSTLRKLDLKNASFSPVEKKGIVHEASGQLYHLLEEVGENLNEFVLKGIIEHLLYSLDHDRPYCHIFDPFLSDVERIKQSIESSLQTIENPSDHIKVNLNIDSKLKLDYELSKRTNDIQECLGQRLTKERFEQLNKDAISVFTIANFVKAELCSTAAKKVMKMLEESTRKYKNKVFEAIKIAIDSDKMTKFDENFAKSTKYYIEGSNQLNSIISECQKVFYGIEYLEDECKENEDDPFIALSDQLENNAHKVKEEARKVETFIFPKKRSISESSYFPNFQMIAAKLAQLRMWSSAFDKNIQTIYDNSKSDVIEIITKSVKEGVHKSKDASTGVWRAELSVRTLAVVQEVRDTGVLKYMKKDKALKFWSQFRDEKFVAETSQILQLMLEKAQLSVKQAFDGPNFISRVDMDGETKYKEFYSEMRAIMSNIEHVILLMKERKLHDRLGVNLRNKVLLSSSIEFMERAEMCSRLISILPDKSGSGKLLELCFKSLGIFIDSFPISMVKEAQFNLHLQKVHHNLERKLVSISSKLEMLINQMKSNTQNLDFEGQKRSVDVLRSCTWFDGVLEKSKSSREPFVLKTLSDTDRLFTECAENLNTTGKFMINSLLNSENYQSDADTVNDIETLVLTATNLVSISELNSGEDNSARIASEGIFRAIDNWSEKTSKRNFTELLENGEFDRLQHINEMARSLSKLDEIGKIRVVKITDKMETALRAYNSYILSIMEKEDSFTEKSYYLGKARMWSEYTIFSSTLPTYDAMKDIVRKQVIGRSGVLQDKILESESNDLQDLETELQKFSEAGKSVDEHINGEATNWINILNASLETQKNNIDEQFKELLEKNDFGQIQSHLETFSFSENKRDKQNFTKYMKLISVHLHGHFHNLQSAIIYPSDSPKLDQDDISSQWHRLSKASKVLGKFSDNLPVCSGRSEEWNLSEDLNNLVTTARKKRDETVGQIKKYSDEYKFIKAFSLLDHVNVLHSLLMEVPGNWTDSLRKAMEKGKVDGVQNYIKNSLERIEKKVILFLNVLETSHDSTERTLTNIKQGSGNLLMLGDTENNMNENKFPPNTSDMRFGLDMLKNATETSECPITVQECYRTCKTMLNSRLDEIVETLKKEVDTGMFTRALEILGFLRDELNSRDLRKHMKVTFEPEALILDIAGRKNDFLSDIDFHNESEIDKLEKILKSMSSSGKGWHKRDYEHYVDLANENVEQIYNVVFSKIARIDFSGVRRRIEVLETNHLKLGKWLRLDKNYFKPLLIEFKKKVMTFPNDMKALLEVRDYEQFSTVFAEYHNLMREVNNGNRERKRQGKGTFVMQFDKICGELQADTHRHLLEHSRDSLQKFEDCVSAKDYHTAASYAANLNNLGYVLGSSFEAYKNEVCKASLDPNIKELSSVVKKSFAQGRFLKIGESMAILRLPPSAEFEDIAEAFKAQSLRWHPDKNKADPYAGETFDAIMKARRTLKNDEKTIEFYKQYDFLYFQRFAANFGNRFKLEVKEAMDRNEYDTVANACDKLMEVDAITKQANGENIVKLLDASELQKWASENLKNKSQALALEIQKSSKAQDFVPLYHSFRALEELETAFSNHLDIVPTSVTGHVLEGMIKNLEKLKEDCAFLQGKNQSFAMQYLDDFGLRLIKMGFYLDGFPRLKEQARKLINIVLNGIQTERWGVSFLFQLGMRLKNGDISGDNEDDKRIGRVLVSSFPHFKEVEVVVFNTRAKVTANVSEGISKMKSEKFDGYSGTKELHINKKSLSTAFKIYEKQYQDYFGKYISSDKKELVEEVKSVVKSAGKCNLKNWNDAFKSKIPVIVAGVFATYSIMRSGNTFKQVYSDEQGQDAGVNKMDMIFKPHNIQVLSIFRLLGIGAPDRGLQNQIMEIRTGEGKSIILGCLSVVLALLGFSVRCVCYSEHLSERDNNLFKDIFMVFDVESKIKYSKITTMSEQNIAKHGDIRKMTEEMIAGSTKLEGSQKKAHKIESEVLLVDEVDVFFGSDFYGKTYNQAANLEDGEIEQLVREIWKNRKRVSTRAVHSWSIYQSILKRFPEFENLIKKEVDLMCADVAEFGKPSYEVDVEFARIGYTVRDSIEWDIQYGYRTAFAYLCELEKRTFKGARAEKNVKQALHLKIPCGQFSYANISPDLVLGVSGTLSALTTSEKKIVNEFNVRTYTYMPSVYGKKNLEFDIAGRGISVHSTKSDYLQSIAQSINDAIMKDRAAIAFFESDAKLREFMKSHHWPKFRHANSISSHTKTEDREYNVEKAATSRQVTIATAAFGRGTDFFCNDPKLESIGGLKVIQTFLSVEKSEEIQIMGRTARQGQNGSYCMVLLEDDLTEKFEIRKGDCERKSKEELYDFLDSKRGTEYEKVLMECNKDLKESGERDTISRKYLDALSSGNIPLAKNIFFKVYELCRVKQEVSFAHCRLVILSDATGSMHSIWNKTSDCLKNMIDRIDDLGRGNFELLWIAYRDYSDKNLLEKSGWTKDAKTLHSFVTSIACTGGDDFEEAVEWALKEANDEHRKEPISRVILIADAPPHSERKDEQMKSHSRKMTTDYRHETEVLRKENIPVLTIRINTNSDLTESFEYISEETNGASYYLDVDAKDSSKDFTAFICTTALDEIGGSALVAEYHAKYGE